MDTQLILHSLVNNTDYCNKVLPYLKEEYFQDVVDKKLFGIINEHVADYNAIPTISVLKSKVQEIRGLNQSDFERAGDVIIELEKPYKSPDFKWLVDESEKWCQHQSIFLAVGKAIAIIQDDSKTPKTAIPEILKDALAVSFNLDIGHDYVENVEDRYDKLHLQTARLKFDIDAFNKVFAGGVPRKTLNLFMGAAGSGKSLVKSHVGAHFYQAGYNVLYVTLELSEERIGERFDANLFGIDVIDIPGIPLETYKAKVANVSKRTKGARLFIKEYPPASITPSHIRSLLDELELKKGFKCDVLIVDYLNLLTSARFKASNGANSYTIIKSVCEELRSVAVEKDLAVFSSTQYNRSGVSNSDPSMTDTSESMGITHTADALIAIVRTEELDDMNQVMFKVLKTRFSDLTNWRFLTGLNLNQMKLLDLGAQTGKISQESSKLEEKSKPAFVKSSGNKSKFSDLNV